jgi:predicted TIM-barrel fold metal-dependent hydrolase
MPDNWWLHDTTSATYRIVFAGVFDRYPSIRIITHHSGAFLPVHAPRLDASWALFEHAGIALPTKVSKPYIDHFRKFYCDTAVFGFAPKVLEIALDFFGPERVIFGSDAPFDVTGGQYFTTETLRSIEAMAIAPEVRISVLSTTASRMLKIS